MKFFISNFDLNNIKIKFILLYILNITDITFTLFLCRTGYYAEANFIMEPIINNGALSLFIKVIVTAFLLSFIYFRMKSATNSQLKKSNYFISFILLAYTFINLSHIFWTLYYLYFLRF